MKLLHKLLNGVNIKQTYGPTNIPIAALCFNSQKATRHTCFVAIVGTQVDGHDYISTAIAAGSSAIVCDQLPAPGYIDAKVTYIVVGSTSKALGIMAANFYDHPSKKLKLVAVTGTNGKTTVVHLLYNLFMQMNYKVGMVSTNYYKVADQAYAASHTTPDTLQLHVLLKRMVEADCAYCFMEASSHAMIQDRLVGLELAGAIFTNITHEHLDYHHHFTDYIWAKKKLFDALPATSFALVNKQDRNSTTMLQNCKAKHFTFSLQGAADFNGKVISNTLHGLEMQLDDQRIWFQLLGAFNGSNLLAAYGAAQLLGLDSPQSLVMLSAIPPIVGRMYRVSHGQLPLAIIDYAHTPDALEQVMKSIGEMRMSNSRLFTVMGCGGNRDKQKRSMLGKVLTEYSDIAIFTSDNPRDEDPKEIIRAMHEGVPIAARPKVLHILDRAMAIKAACLLAQANDIILVAGKGHQHYEEIQGIRHYFCEEQIIQESLSYKAMVFNKG